MPDDSPNHRSVVFLEIPLAAAGLLFAFGIGWWDGILAGLAAFVVAAASFGLGLLLLLWLYRFAERRVEKSIQPRKWEYTLERHGHWLLPPAIGLGMWASQFGANATWGDVLGVACFLSVAGFTHGLAFVTPPNIPESYRDRTH